MNENDHNKKIKTANKIFKILFNNQLIFTTKEREKF